LRLAGRATDPGIAAAVRAAVEADARVTARLDHLPDGDLVDEVERAQLVVLPYRDLHNSGALLLALSLDRPVLVPRNAVTDALAAEVGDAWVRRYEGDLAADHLAGALAATAAPAGAPDLAARDWPGIGRQHADLFRAAVRAARGGRS
jgi:beta-1,4-mannosyltransferase